MADFCPKFCCCFGGGSRHTSSTTAMYCPLGDYLSTMVKLGPLAKSDFCASMRGEEDRFTIHLAMLLSEEDVPILVEDIANVVVVLVVTVVGIVGVAVIWLLGYDWPLKLSYM